MRTFARLQYRSAMESCVYRGIITQSTWRAALLRVYFPVYSRPGNKASEARGALCELYYFLHRFSAGINKAARAGQLKQINIKCAPFKRGIAGDRGATLSFPSFRDFEESFFLVREKQTRIRPRVEFYRAVRRNYLSANVIKSR